MNLDIFLNQHKLEKGSGKRYTHTRIPSQKNEFPIVYPGSY